MSVYTLNNIGSLEGNLQYYYKQPQENPARVLMGGGGVLFKELILLRV